MWNISKSVPLGKTIKIDRNSFKIEYKLLKDGNWEHGGNRYLDLSPHFKEGNTTRMKVVIKDKGFNDRGGHEWPIITVEHIEDEQDQIQESRYPPNNLNHINIESSPQISEFDIVSK